MSASRTFNVYCDESCHLEPEILPVMAWGAVYCAEAKGAQFADAVRALWPTHG